MRRKGISLGAAKSLEVRGCDAAGCRQSCGAWRGDGGWQPWPVCVRRKWKTTEQTEGLSTAPRRPAQQSLKPCYYSSPDGNLPAHLLFSSSRLFHNRKKKKKKREISPIFLNYLPVSLGSLWLTAFRKSPTGPPGAQGGHSLCQQHRWG